MLSSDCPFCSCADFTETGICKHLPSALLDDGMQLKGLDLSHDDWGVAGIPSNGLDSSGSTQTGGQHHSLPVVDVPMDVHSPAPSSLSTTVLLDGVKSLPPQSVMSNPHDLMIESCPGITSATVGPNYPSSICNSASSSPICSLSSCEPYETFQNGSIAKASAGRKKRGRKPLGRHSIFGIRPQVCPRVIIDDSK